MKKHIIISTLLALAAVSTQAQGLINFSNGSTARIFTNAVVGGPAFSLTGTDSSGPIYYFALCSSTNEASVNGQTAAISGAASLNYAFNDTNWTLVAYGSNFNQSGEFVSDGIGSPPVSVPGVPGGSSAQFVVIGWPASLGKNIAALQSWFNAGSPSQQGWIGQSAVSGAITLGTSTAATLFGTSAPEIPGFTLGLVVPSGPVAPVITAQPVSETAATGAGASFSVSAYGTPSPAYQWMFNGSNVIPGATGPTLTLADVQSTNAGAYSVVITNSAGSTNSYAATLTVTAPSGTGYVQFESINLPNTNSASITKICTNSAVGGPATGLTAPGANLYYYALYASATATSVLGQTAAISGAASSNYAFNDTTDWTLVAYGTNSFRGMLSSSTAAGAGAPTPLSGFSPGTTAQFVVVGWSGNIGSDIAAVTNWFNDGSPASNGWIGQSAVSGSIEVGNLNNPIPAPILFNTSAPYLQGFILGLASPTPSATYVVPYAPPAMMQTSMNGKYIQISWPTASGSWGVQSAPTPVGPWTDTGWKVTTVGADSVATATNASPGQYYRLAAQ